MNDTKEGDKIRGQEHQEKEESCLNDEKYWFKRIYDSLITD